MVKGGIISLLTCALCLISVVSLEIVCTAKYRIKVCVEYA